MEIYTKKVKTRTWMFMEAKLNWKIIQNTVTEVVISNKTNYIEAKKLHDQNSIGTGLYMIVIFTSWAWIIKSLLKKHFCSIWFQMFWKICILTYFNVILWPMSFLFDKFYTLPYCKIFDSVMQNENFRCYPSLFFDKSS